jgi:hypothetical protein
MYGWGGTATHLRLTIPQAREKLAAAQRSANKPRRQLVDLNVPVFRGTTTS